MKDEPTPESASSSTSRSDTPRRSESDSSASRDDAARAELKLPPATWDTEAGRIRGSDGEWYDVPEPVLLRYMSALALSSQRGLPPKLIRAREPVPDNARTVVAPEATFLLLLTDALLGEVTRYFENGDLDALVDLVEVAASVVELRGLERAELFEMLAAKRNAVGGYLERRLLMPTPAQES